MLLDATPPTAAFAPLDEVLDDLRAGRMIVLCTGGTGAIVMAAADVDAAAVNLMAREARGVVGVALAHERSDALGLREQPVRGGSAVRTLMVPVEAATGVTTGISAADRARTIAVLGDPGSAPADVAAPGHVVPLRAAPGGVVERAGQAEVVVDLLRLAGLAPAGALCDMLDDAGAVADVATLGAFAARHGLALASADDVVARRRAERGAAPPEIADVDELAGPHGAFTAVRFAAGPDGRRHVALVRGRPAGEDEVLAHVHRACVAGDVLGAVACPCAGRLAEALAAIANAGRGVVVVLGEPGTSCADRADAGPLARHGEAAELLAALGVRRARFMHPVG